MRQLAEATLYPVVPTWSDTFYDQESSTDHHWRWSGSQRASIALVNPAPETRIAHFATTVRIPSPAATASVVYPDGTTVRVRGGRDTRIARTLRLAPNSRETITFSTDAPAFHAPSDPRTLVFALVDTGFG